MSGFLPETENGAFHCVPMRIVRSSPDIREKKCQISRNFYVSCGINRLCFHNTFSYGHIFSTVISLSVSLLVLHFISRKRLDTERKAIWLLSRCLPIFFSPNFDLTFVACNVSTWPFFFSLLQLGLLLAFSYSRISIYHMYECFPSIASRKTLQRNGFGWVELTSKCFGW